MTPAAVADVRDAMQAALDDSDENDCAQLLVFAFYWTRALAAMTPAHVAET